MKTYSFETSSFLYSCLVGALGSVGFVKYFYVVLDAVYRDEMGSMVYTFKNAVLLGYPAFIMYVLWFIASGLLLGGAMSYFWNAVVARQALHRF